MTSVDTLRTGVGRTFTSDGIIYMDDLLATAAESVIKVLNSATRPPFCPDPYIFAHMSHLNDSDHQSNIDLINITQRRPEKTQNPVFK